MVFSVESGKRGASRSGRSEPPKKEIGPQGVEPLAVSRCVPLYTARFVPNRKKPVKDDEKIEGERPRGARTDRRAPLATRKSPRSLAGPHGNVRRRLRSLCPLSGAVAPYRCKTRRPFCACLGRGRCGRERASGRLACTRPPFRAGHGLGHRPGDFADGGERRWEERLCERAKAVRRVLRRRIDAPFWEVDVRERSQHPLNSASASGRNAS